MDDDALVRAELEQCRAAARRTLRRGVAAVALVPIVALATIGLAAATGAAAVMAAAVVCGGLYTLFGSLYGFAMITAGTIESRRLTRTLHDHDARRQLPEARVVIRD